MAKNPSPKLDLSGSIESIAAKLSKKYGENTVITASQAQGLTTKFISTGVFELDFALGGGFAENRFTEIRGGFSSLKTTVTLAAFKNFCDKYPDGLGLFDDVEHTYDPKYAQSLGIDPSRLLVSNPDSGEQAVDVMLDFLTIRNRPIFIVLDSIAALTPMAEQQQESMEQQSMGLQARLVNKMMRLANARVKRSLYDADAPSATIIFLNQLREKIGLVFGNPETTPGGKGKDFYYSVMLRFGSSPSKAIKEEVEQNGVKRKIRFGQLVDFSVLKNKVGGSQYEEGEFEYYVKSYNGYPPYSFNNYDALMRYGVYYGVISQSNGMLRAQGLSAKKEAFFIKKLRENPEAVKSIYEGILQKIADSEKKGALIDVNSAVEQFESAEEVAAEEEAAAEEVIKTANKAVKAAKKYLSFKK
jgi:recombination protein RecA